MKGDLKLSEGITEESIESLNTNLMDKKLKNGLPWKSVQVKKLNLNNIKEPIY